MHGIEVGTVVDSILAAFDNATDVFKRIKNDVRGRRIKKDISLPDNEKNLYQALSEGPAQIKSRFSQSLAKHGNRFVVGDAYTQTKLAQTLLTLNNGLMEIINLMLNREPTSKILPTQTLLKLSRKATHETLDALQTLDERLTIHAAADSHGFERHREKKPKKQLKANRQEKLQAHVNSTSLDQNPLLIRGGWIKTRSGDFIVVSADGARKRAAQKNNKKHTSPGKRLPSRKRVPQEVARDVDHVPYTKEDISEKISHESSPHVRADSSAPLYHSNPPVYEAQRPPSTFLVSAEVFNQHEVAIDHLPPRPPKIPLHTRPNPSLKQRPASGVTFMTVSTKIGEIPEHRLPDRFLSPDELAHRPLPYTVPPALEQASPKARRGFWRFKLKG